MRKYDWGDIFVSVLVGALVAFLSAFAEGLADALNGFGNNATGGIASTLYIMTRHLV